MASNGFGTLFRIVTWGESHGPAIGVVIDGCPAGLKLSAEDLMHDLARRAPGQAQTSPRKESDLPHILSGVFEGTTTGAPISIIFYNQDVDSSKYTSLKNVLRPGHASYTYLEKYGIFDYRGGGRASGRETACRVAAGAVARKLLSHYDIACQAHLLEEEEIRKRIADNPSDSFGGVIEFSATGLPAGLGDPIYEKLEAKLAAALLSIPATKGFELGAGFQAAAMTGSLHNDTFTLENQQVVTTTNHAGGALGGISTGMPLVGRVAFKPTSSIPRTQTTLTTSKKAITYELPAGSRHDPCIALRAAPVVEAMVLLVLADTILMNRLSKLN
jgi:chorismate synthase